MSPNWAVNRLKITGPKRILYALRDAVVKTLVPSNGQNSELQSNLFSLEKIIPYLDGVWDYDWCCRNWDTKWDTSNVELNEHPRSLVYTFDTAWSPPVKVIKALSRMYPHLNFDLEAFEGGVGYRYRLIIKKGMFIKEETKEYRGRLGG